MIAGAAVAWPLVRTPPSDGFPLSNYPMFTQARPAQSPVDLAIGIDSEGNEVELSPRLVGGSIEVINAVSALADAIARSEAPELCSAVAGRVGNDTGRTGIVEVWIVTDTYDVVAAVTSDAPAIDRFVHARCQVKA